VTPFTSLTGSGFTMYPWVMGQEAMAVGSYDPCCQVIAGFSMANPGNDYAWDFTNTSTNATSYSWTFGDGTTSTEESPNHTYAANGQYTVCLTVTGTCGTEPTTANNCQSIAISVGIDELYSASIAPVLYPSPATDGFIVMSPKRIEMIRLADSQGRIVRILQVQDRSQVNMPVQDLPAGAYVAHVVLANGNTYPLRVMVAH